MIGGLFGLIFIKQKLYSTILIIFFLLIFIIYNKYYLALLPFLFGWILYQSSLNKKISLKKDFFINRLFQLIGKISYSIYLTHSLVLWIAIQIFNIFLKVNVYEFTLLNTILFLILLYFLTTIVAYLSYKYIENFFYQKL
jgi:peptidoglycan/LPS O-acetylase OafA/YrhL